MGPSRDEGRSFGLAWAVTREGGLVTLALNGELDLASVDSIQEVLDGLVSEGPVLVLDLEKLEFMDSTGLRLLGRVHQTAEQKGSRLLLGRVSPAVRRVIHVAGLLDFFDYVEGAPPDETLCKLCDNWVPTTAQQCPHCGSTLRT